MKTIFCDNISFSNEGLLLTVYLNVENCRFAERTVWLTMIAKKFGRKLKQGV